MIVQPHNTLATDQPTSTQRTNHHTVNGHHDVAVLTTVIQVLALLLENHCVLLLV